MECFIENIVTDSRVTTDVKTLIPDATMRRRMSAVLKSAVSTAIECVGGVEGVDSLDAIITASGWGCLADSEKFLRNVIEQQEELLNPTPFIQSTFNTVGAQVALLRHNHCYNMTYVNRSHSFEDALLDALMCVHEGHKRVLVGAYDEVTPTAQRLIERMGLLRHCTSGEGSVFTLLTVAPTAHTVAKISKIDFPSRSLSAEQCLERYASSRDAVVSWNEYRSFGLYPTASAKAFAVAAESVAQTHGQTIIYNEYFGATPTVVVMQWVG